METRIFSVLLLSVRFGINFALPAQKFSPGIPITPIVDEQSGLVSGILTNQASTNPGTQYQQPVPQSNQYQPAEVSTFPVNLPGTNNRIEIPTNSAIGQPTQQVQLVPRPQPTVIYMTNNRPYYSAPQYSGQYVYPSGMAAPPRPSGGPISQYISNTVTNVANRLQSPTSLETISTFGTLGTIGALGALGAGAVLFG
ncbi:uncharacterized protein LOC129725440 [Wyeomyia smithii]|uniref:uncharacterized protein LOC129725440 n=1 Tax=Wyeomyia smithii TaxID=174621 RepID=UPI0024680D6E|nr:uncharacterized protein LOC129725440 [Wyeomyia smithii]